MRLEPTPLGFTYRITYVPKGARNPCLGFLRGADFAVVRHIEPAEAAPAFRVKRSKMDIWPFVFPRKPRAGQTGFVRNAFTFEVLLYEGVLWWPYLQVWEVQTRARSAAECLEGIRSDHYLFGAPDITAGLRIMEEPPKMSNQEDDYDC